MFRTLTNLLARRQAPCPAPSASVPPQSEPTPTRFDACAIQVSAHAVPQLRRVAGITRFDLTRLLAGGHCRSLRERAIGAGGTWATTPASRAALTTAPRELHLLVFDPEREAFFIAYAKADARASRLTITGVVGARDYEQAHWHLLPLAPYRELCAQAVASAQERTRILEAALGERDPRALPIVFALQSSKRTVWVEVRLRDGREKRLGVLPFALKQQRIADLPQLAAFWDWVQSRREGKTPIDRESVAAVRLLGQRDPLDLRIELA